MSPPPLKIRLYGDPCLRKKSILLSKITPEKQQLIQDMVTTMQAHKGVGLAAPQIGVNERFFVVDVGDGPLVLINPHITRKSGSEQVEEGCLSIPGVLVEVKRPFCVVVKYRDETNQEHRLECTDLLARVIQHENDHLDGKLIIDYAPLLGKFKMKKKLKQIVAQGNQ